MLYPAAAIVSLIDRPFCFATVVDADLVEWAENSSTSIRKSFMTSFNHLAIVAAVTGL